MEPGEDVSLMNSSFIRSVRPVRFSACAIRAAAISSRRDRADCTGAAAAGAETPASRGFTPSSARRRRRPNSRRRGRPVQQQRWFALKRPERFQACRQIWAVGRLGHRFSRQQPRQRSGQPPAPAQSKRFWQLIHCGLAEQMLLKRTHLRIIGIGHICTPLFRLRKSSRTGLLFCSAAPVLFLFGRF